MLVALGHWFLPLSAQAAPVRRREQLATRRPKRRAAPPSSDVLDDENPEAFPTLTGRRRPRARWRRPVPHASNADDIVLDDPGNDPILGLARARQPRAVRRGLPRRHPSLELEDSDGEGAWLLPFTFRRRALRQRPIQTRGAIFDLGVEELQEYGSEPFTMRARLLRRRRPTLRVATWEEEEQDAGPDLLPHTFRARAMRRRVPGRRDVFDVDPVLDDSADFFPHTFRARARRVAPSWPLRVPPAFDLEEVVDDVGPDLLPHTFRARMARTRRPAPARRDAFDLEEVSEDGGGGPDLMPYTFRARAARARRVVPARRESFDLEPVGNDDEPGWMNIVRHSGRPRRFRLPTRGPWWQVFELEAPQPERAPVIRKAVSEYVRKTLFVRTGQKIGQRSRR